MSVEQRETRTGWDWEKIAVWTGIFLLCTAIWTMIVIGIVRVWP